MFSYYGSKSKVVDLYPAPRYGKIIEPFAGSARYSLKYWDRDVVLVDKYDVIIRIWKWLQKCSPQDILKLPEPKLRQTIRPDMFDCEEAFLLMSFVIKSGSATPSLTVSSNRGEDGQIADIKKGIANQLDKIRKWDIRLGDYASIENQEATWFIDPPYQFGGEFYKVSNKNISYPELAKWCVSRKGQIIVCENTKADWMPFWAIGNLHGTKHTTTEAIWLNDQQQLSF